MTPEERKFAEAYRSAVRRGLNKLLDDLDQTILKGEPTMNADDKLREENARLRKLLGAVVWHGCRGSVTLNQAEVESQDDFQIETTESDGKLRVAVTGYKVQTS